MHQQTIANVTKLNHPTGGWEGSAYKIATAHPSHLMVRHIARVYLDDVYAPPYDRAGGVYFLQNFKTVIYF